MQRRLNIALALVHDPELIILDEPQAGLDPQSRILVRDVIRQLGQNKTIILTTHDMDEADRLSDRVAIVDRGRILATGTPDSIKTGAGAGDILQVRAPGISDASVQNILKRLPSSVIEKKFSDGCFFIGADGLHEQLPAIGRVFGSAGVRIEDMTIRKRTLEDAFIAMTGRGLRE
jgi:ABC-2 type transport system ATP-binding protein